MRRTGALLCVVLTHALIGLPAAASVTHTLRRLQSLHELRLQHLHAAIAWLVKRHVCWHALSEC